MKNNPAVRILPAVSGTLKNIFSEIITDKAKIAGGVIHKISPHISVASEIIIHAVEKKSDYSQDLVVLVDKMGVPVKEAAKHLGMSVSYAYQLLRSARK